MTEYHTEITVRIDTSTTITLSDEFGGLGSFINDKLRKAPDVIERMTLLVKMLEETIDYHRCEMRRLDIGPEKYTEYLAYCAKCHSVYDEREV